eukprot:g38885.t1
MCTQFSALQKEILAALATLVAPEADFTGPPFARKKGRVQIRHVFRGSEIVQYQRAMLAAKSSDINGRCESIILHQSQGIDKYTEPHCLKAFPPSSSRGLQVLRVCSAKPA